MTEQEWLECTDPTPMLEFLRSKANERKVRLFACACIRRIWHFLPDEPTQAAVHIFERIADEQATEQEFAKAKKAADDAEDSAMDGLANAVAHSLSFFVDSIESEQYQEDALIRIAGSASATADAVGANSAIAIEREAPQRGPGEFLSETIYRMGQEAAEIAKATEKVGQANVLREIVGNPFCYVGLNPEWLAWRDGTIPKMAQAIYEDRAFDYLPVLADALEEAGCIDANILAHCRKPGPHVRGCWVVDLLLGKE